MTSYDAKFLNLPAQNGEVEINDWVNRITQGKITNIIDSVSQDTAVLIVNALYFKASWAKSFKKGKKLQEFTKLDGQKVFTNMITRDSKKQAVARFTTNLLSGAGGDECIALAIPYEHPSDPQKLGRFEMLIIMPEHHIGLQNFQYNAEKAAKNNAYNQKGNIIEMALASLENSRKKSINFIINMPEFKIDSNIKAIEFLRKLGIKDAFDKGDFDGIIKDGTLKASNIKHRAAIEVTKEGTVAVAASAIDLVPLSAGFSNTIDIKKPFLFFIRDVELNTILFAGKYSDPEDGNTPKN